MHRFAAAVLGINLLSSLGSLLHAQAAERADSVTWRAVDSVFAPFNRTASPGCALAVVQEGTLTHSRGYGLASLEHGVPIDENTVFDIASVSKQFTAAAVGLLALEGRLSLDDDIHKYLPEIPTFGATVTVRHLLTHTSGLRNYIDLLWYSGHRFEEVTTEADALALLRRQHRLNVPPGEEFRYSNTGYLLAGLIVRRVTGKSLGEFLHQQIFTPFGMRSTQLVDDHTAVIPAMAAGYEPRDSAHFARADANWEQVGDGGVYTTVSDLARWEGRLPQLSVGGRSLLALLQQPGRMRQGTRLNYGLGVFVDSADGLRRLQHEGSWAGYRAGFVRYPERRLSVIVLCNVTIANALGLAQNVAELFLGGRGAAAASSRGTSAVITSPERVHAFSGTYFNRHLGLTLPVTDSAGSLSLAGLKMSPLVSGEFTDEARIVRATFDTSVGTLTIAGLVPQPATFERARKASLAAPVAAYLGRYESPELDGAWIVHARGDTLVLEVPPGIMMDLMPVGGALYTNGDGLLEFRLSGRARGAELWFTNRGLVDLRLRGVR